MVSGSNIGGEGGIPHPQYADLSEINRGKISFTNAADGRIIQLAAKKIERGQKIASDSVAIRLTDIKSKKTMEVSVKTDELVRLGLTAKEVGGAMQERESLFETRIEELTEKPPRTPQEMFSKLTKLFYDLYSAKENLGNSTLLEKAFAILYPEGKPDDIREFVAIFERMLEVILSDVEEEVVGQERQPEAIPKLVKTNKKPEEYADLYPLALLAASFDARAPKPATGSIESALRHDVETFREEFKSQFPRANRTQWEAMFGPCLKQVWTTK